MRPQQTLRQAVEFVGVGLHTGAPARVSVGPAPADAGLVFVLASGRVRVPARAEFVVETRRATVLGQAGATISTVEHLLSALVGLGIDNAEIACDGPEIPILDGSAAPFVEAFTGAGIGAQDTACVPFTVAEPVVFRDGEAMLVVAPADDFRVRVAVDFPAPVGALYLDRPVTASWYATEIAPARTFGYLHEVEALRAAGLARGGSLENALVFDADGPLVPLRWSDEVVRHKALDLIGDLALLGRAPQLDVLAVRSGHHLHAIATAALRAGRPAVAVA